MLRDGDRYLAYATNAGGRNVQVWTSPDLAHWDDAGDALPVLPAWGQPGHTWAPVVLDRPGGPILYYTLREPRSGRQAISLATATRAEGPFADRSSGPLVFQESDGGSIDPSPFVDVDGTAYLLWKADTNAVGRPSSLWIRPLAPDGLAFAGPSTRLLQSERRWEEPLIEAPALVHHDGTYHLFYSANRWESNGYAIGHATALSPVGPFTRSAGRAWRAGQPWWWPVHRVLPDAAATRLPGTAGPGGQELFTDGDGRLWMAFHAWEPGRVGYRHGGRRGLHLAEVRFGGDGLPTTVVPPS